MTKRWVDRKKDGQTDGRMDGHMDGLCKNIMAGHLSVEEYENVSNFCNAKTVNIFQQKKKITVFYDVIINLISLNNTNTNFSLIFPMLCLAALSRK